jgi:hypothetical protein
LTELVFFAAPKKGPLAVQCAALRPVAAEAAKAVGEEEAR